MSEAGRVYVKTTRNDVCVNLKLWLTRRLHKAFFACQSMQSLWSLMVCLVYSSLKSTLQFMFIFIIKKKEKKVMVFE